MEEDGEWERRGRQEGMNAKRRVRVQEMHPWKCRAREGVGALVGEIEWGKRRGGYEGERPGGSDNARGTRAFVCCAAVSSTWEGGTDRGRVE